MSIILDALKKAEKDRAQSENTSLETKAVPEKNKKAKKSSPILIVLFIIVGMGALGYLSYTYFFKNRFPIRASQPLTTTGPSQKENPEQMISLFHDEAVKLYLQGDYSGAQKKLEQLLAKYESLPEAHNNLGLVYKKQGKSELALASYEKALELKPDYPEALNNMGALYLESDQLERAKEVLLEAISLNPQYADAIFHLAIVYDREGSSEEALQNYNRFLSMKEGIDSMLKGHIEMRIALIEAQRNRIR